MSTSLGSKRPRNQSGEVSPLAIAPSSSRMAESSRRGARLH